MNIQKDTATLSKNDQPQIKLFSGVLLLALGGIIVSRFLPFGKPPEAEQTTNVPKPYTLFLRETTGNLALQEVTEKSGKKLIIDSSAEKWLQRRIAVDIEESSSQKAMQQILHLASGGKALLRYEAQGKNIHIFNDPLAYKGLPTKRVSLSYTSWTPLETVLQSLFSGTNLSFRVEDIPFELIQVELTDQTFDEAFRNVLTSAHLPVKYKQGKDNVIVISPDLPPRQIAGGGRPPLSTQPINFSVENVPMSQALRQLLTKSCYGWSMSNKVDANCGPVTVNLKNVNMKTALSQILRQSRVPMMAYVENDILLIRRQVKIKNFTALTGKPINPAG